MQIVLDFNRQRLIRDAQRGRELSFTIAWEHKGVYYPSATWVDFGEAILDSWILATIRLLEGADEDKYLFMEGPYSIEILYDRRTGFVNLTPERAEFVWRVRFTDVILALIRAVDTVCQELTRIGIADHNRPTLRPVVEMLEAAMKRAGIAYPPNSGYGDE